MLVGVLAVMAVAAALLLPATQDAVAQPPTVDSRLDLLQDDVVRLQSELSDARSDLSQTLTELSALRGDIAVLSDRVGRLSRSGRLETETSEASAFTQSFVEKAISRYERDGRDATIAHYNTPDSVEGQWYLIIIDENGMIIAHPNADLVGAATSTVMSDDGYPVGRIVDAAARASGRWVSYRFNNASIDAVQLKHTWTVLHDGLVFASGWYEDGPSAVHAPGAYTQAYVQRAIQLHDLLGRQAALDYYNTPNSADGQWYMFIHRTDGTRLAHAYRGAGWLGTNIGETGVDVSGYRYGEDVLAIETSGWVSYVFTNPADDDQYRRKHSWIVTHGGLQFASGWYEQGYDLKAEDPAAYSKILVQEAIDRYDSEGREAALAYHNSKASVDGAWYVFIIDEDGARLAHPTRPDLVGQLVQEGPGDANGYRYGEDFITVTESAWISYVFGNPERDQLEQKHTWLVRHDGLLFGAGWYEPGAYQAEQTE